MKNRQLTSSQSPGLLDWLLEGVFDGDGAWRWVRLLFVLNLIVFIAYMAEWWIERRPPVFPNWLYFLPPLMAVLGALLHSARFLQDIFEIGSFRLVFRHLFSSLFFLLSKRFWRFYKYPEVVIDHGRYELEGDELDIVKKIGGPVSVYVRPGNAVVVEHFWHPKEIFDVGWRLIHRFSRIKGIIDLREQECACAMFSAISKDGLEIRVKDAGFRYRTIAPKDTLERSRLRPYPYDEDAASKIASDPEKWQAVVRGQFESVIKEFIAEKQFDYITNFQAGDARDELRKIMKEKGAENFKKNGAELIWFDLGNFDYETAIKDQHLHKWQEEWIGNARIERSYGEAKIIAYRELGRAEAQAEMLMSIVHALDDIGLSDNPVESRQNIRSLILIRTAQILESISINDIQDQDHGGKLR
jgi:hypothetical protein